MEKKYGPRLKHWNRFGDYVPCPRPEFCRNGIEYVWELAGSSGASFHLWPAPGRSLEEIQDAARELLFQRDVVGCISWSYRPEGPASDPEDADDRRAWRRMRDRFAAALNAENRARFLAMPEPDQLAVIGAAMKEGIISY